jgi:beta-aspartyl-peptidase (threonine type)
MYNNLKLPLIVVHGGAGSWEEEKLKRAVPHVEKAARIGYNLLTDEYSALDAAEACTTYMENCGSLNAGIGARPNKDGVRELDAMIVDGFNLEFGSVAAITGIQNPTSLARYIMEKTDHNFFAGGNAKRLYEEMIDSGYRESDKESIIRPIHVEGVSDTVGCVAVDKKERIAATSSTGGIKEKIPGRVGDSPIFGAGAYANRICGATATGYGEHITRTLLCRMAVLQVEEGKDLSIALLNTMDDFENLTKSEAGIIMADSKGNYATLTNAKAMPICMISAEVGEPVVATK